MASAFHMLRPRSSGRLTPTASMAKDYGKPLHFCKICDEQIRNFNAVRRVF